VDEDVERAVADGGGDAGDQLRLDAGIEDQRGRAPAARGNVGDDAVERGARARGAADVGAGRGEGERALAAEAAAGADGQGAASGEVGPPGGVVCHGGAVVEIFYHRVRFR